MFRSAAPGKLVPIRGNDPVLGEWEHRAFVPDPLPNEMPELRPATYLGIANARAALAALDSTARQLPNPTLLRMPTLRREAQSTSALEGTYAPLAEVLTADEDDPLTPELVEIFNYVRMANFGFARIAEGWPLSISLLSELQGILMMATPLHTARFVPPPEGHVLETGVRDLIDWMRSIEIRMLILSSRPRWVTISSRPFIRFATATGGLDAS